MSEEKLNKIEKLFIGGCLLSIVISVLSTLNNQIGITIDEQYAQVTFYDLGYAFATVVIIVVVVAIITSIVIVNFKARRKS